MTPGGAGARDMAGALGYEWYSRYAWCLRYAWCSRSRPGARPCVPPSELAADVMGGRQMMRVWWSAPTNPQVHNRYAATRIRSYWTSSGFPADREIDSEILPLAPVGHQWLLQLWHAPTDMTPLRHKVPALSFHDKEGLIQARLSTSFFDRGQDRFSMDLTYSYLLQTFRQFTWTSAFLSAAALFIGSIVAVREIFKPLHYKKPIKGKRWKLPPGPAGVPLFGNVLQFQRARRDEVDFTKYLSSLASFGEMATLHMGSKTWVLLNSNRVVDELISKRGSVTHERPYMPVALGLVSRGNRFFLQETKRWADARRVLHHLLTGSAVKSCGQLQELESVQLLAAYLHRPREWYSHHYRYSVSLMHQIILGERLLKSTGELDHLRGIIGGFIQCINGNMIDFFPQLDALPKVLQPWRKRYERMGQIHWEGFRTWWEPLKQSVAEGTAMPSLARDVLLCKDTKYPGGDDDAMYLAMSTISAGSDNPRMAMNVFVMAALSYPEPFGKARAEVDRVCGHDANRLPDVDDMTSLPYLCALVKEVIRWRPSVPMIPQHQSIQDLEFEGYLFPAGTEFVINGVAAGQDFPDAESFSPERWLDGENESKVSHGLWHFGGGRRICVGYKIAQTELFLAFSRLIYCFDFAAAGPYDNLRLRHYHAGEPFPVEMKVRNPDHEQLINNQAERFGVLESAKAKF